MTVSHSAEPRFEHPFATPNRQNLALSQWYPIRTQYQYEKRVTAQLSRQGFQTFLPIIHEIHRWSDRNKNVDIPLFSGYTFACLSSQALESKHFLKLSGTLGLITFGGEPATVPAKQIEDLQKLLSSRAPCALHPFLAAGKKVRIRGGSLDGLEGILETTDARNLVISIQSIERALSIRIEGYDLELV